MSWIDFVYWVLVIFLVKYDCLDITGRDKGAEKRKKKEKDKELEDEMPKKKKRKQQKE
jgi:hypothetical protein